MAKMAENGKNDKKWQKKVILQYLISFNIINIIEYLIIFLFFHRIKCKH